MFLHRVGSPGRLIVAAAFALATSGAGCQTSATPSIVGVLSLAVSTESGPTVITGNVPNPCELDVNFGSVPLGLQSTGTVEITNHGTLAVTLETPIPDLDPELDVVFLSALEQPLQPGASASFSISFSSIRTGVATSSLSIPTSLPPSICGASGILIKLTGTGIQLGQISVTPAMIKFGNTLLNTTQQMTAMLSNPSSATLDSIICLVGGADADLFSLTGCPASLPAGGSAAIVVTYAPRAMESRSLADVTFTVEDGPAAILNLVGQPIGVALTLAPDPCDFGYVPLKTTGVCCTTVSNLANVSVQITGVSGFTTQDGAFAVATTDDSTPPNPQTFPANPINLQGGASAELCFSLTPPATQQYTGQVTLITADPTGTNPVLRLTGWGGGPQISCTPPSIDFDQTVDQITATVPVICTNTGTAIPSTNLIIDPPTASPSVFMAQFDETTDVYPLNGLAPGQSAQIDVGYTPTGNSNDQGTLLIKSNGGQGKTLQIPLSGQGLDVAPCQLALSPSQLDFANVRAGDSSVPLSFEIENTGSDICLLQSLRITNDPSGSFHILSTSIAPDPQTQGIVIPAPGAGVTSSLGVTLDFSPATGGSFSGEVAFQISNPQDPNQVVQLAGTSESTCLAAEPASLQFSSVGENSAGALCGSSSQLFMVFNTCNSKTVLKSVTVESGPGDQVPQFALQAGATFPVTFEPGSELPIVYTLSFDPTTVGPHTAELLISDGMVETPISLSGEAVATSTETDSFAVATPEADVLFVMDVADDPASQTDILNAAPGFFQAASGVNYRVAVTTDNDDAPVATAEFGQLLPCPTCSVMGSAPTIISPSSVPDGGTAADPATAFTQLYGAIPSSGYPPSPPSDKHFFLALYNALQNDPAPGVDFFRPGAYFAAITANDDNEDDSSQLGAGGHDEGWFEAFFEAYFMSQPGFSWNYVGSETTTIGTAFINPAELPTNMAHMLTATGGIAVNTADPSWETALDTFWETFSEMSNTYRLSGIPAQGESGIVVTIDGTTIKQLAAPGDWTYQTATNAIVFTTNDPPKIGETVTVTYPICNQ